MNEPDYRAYLLGHMAEADAEQLEARLLDDDEAFETVRSVEDDLVDECARGTLTPEDRERFLAGHPGRADRLAFATALAARTRTKAAAPLAFTPRKKTAIPRSVWIPLAAAAALLIIVGPPLLMPRQGPVVYAPTLNPGTPAPAPAPPAVVALALGTSRAAGDAVAAAVPANASTVQLRVRINPADRYERYSMELRSSAGTSVWRADDLRAAPEKGDLVVSANVPATAIPAGTYELAVRGGTEDLGFITVQVTRTP